MGSGRVGVDTVAGVCVDVPNGGGVGVDTIRVVVRSVVVEVEASVVERVLFFFGQPLPLPTNLKQIYITINSTIN